MYVEIHWFETISDVMTHGQEDHSSHKHVMALAVVNGTTMEVAHGLAKSIVEVGEIYKNLDALQPAQPCTWMSENTPSHDLTTKRVKKIHLSCMTTIQHYTPSGFAKI